MKKVILLLTALLALNILMSAALAKSPLTNYSLYDDVMGKSGTNNDRERAMDEFIKNSLGASYNAKSTNDVSSADDNKPVNYSVPKYKPIVTPTVDIEAAKHNPERRNEILRESSRRIYNSEETPAWEERPMFYQHATLESIREKYHRSDFAGCMQEAESYVRLHPGDTLGFYYLAMSYTKVSDAENAIAAYERVIALHANPMIVKYATNGRNCILENGTEQCFPDVNVPDLIYPYRGVAQMNLTPVDPESLVTRNIQNLNKKYNIANTSKADKNGKGEEAKDGDKKDKIELSLPFGEQDDKLDKFINAPYGNGLSPELNKETTQKDLKAVQQSINQGKEDSNSKNIIQKGIHNINYKKKSDNGSIKIAYDINAKAYDSELSYIEKQKNDYEQMRLLFGNNSNNNKSDIMNILPEMSKENMSPEFVQALMIQSAMDNISL